MSIRGRLTVLERLVATGPCPDEWHQTVRQATVYGPGDPLGRDETPPELSPCPTCPAVQPTVAIRYVKDWRGVRGEDTAASLSSSKVVF